MSPNKLRLFGFLFIFAGAALVYGQMFSEALKLSPEDCILEADTDGGYHLFIRKKPGIGSVLLTASSAANVWADQYVYRVREKNPINGNEVYYLEELVRDMRYPGYLLDSTAAPHERLGSAFEIYIPPLVYLNDESAALPWKPITAASSMPVNIRAFSLPNADPAAGYRDNFYADGKIIRLDTLAPPPPAPLDEAGSDDADVVDGGDADGADGVTAGEGDTLRKPADESPQRLPSILRLWGGAVLFHPGPQSSLYDKFEPVGAVTFSQGLSKIVSFNLGFERDPVLVNRFIAGVAADWENFGFEAGSYFGFLNSGPVVTTPGLSLIFRGNLKGVLSGSFRLDTSLGRSLENSGDYRQDAVGFNLEGITRWVTLTLDISHRTVTRKTDFGDDSVSGWTRFNLSIVHVFRVPTLGLSVGYQRLSHTPNGYTYDAVYAGPILSFKFTPNVELFLNLEAPLYPLDYATVPGAPALLQAELGLTWKLR
ncbi:hypothetical protein FACS1894124_5980 [Spirochaetia bacterium]|nr:hypothetical protein FACS1894124_5980 [Spirochaetia bacterium]